MEAAITARLLALAGAAAVFGSNTSWAASDITVVNPHSRQSQFYVGANVGSVNYDKMDDTDVAWNLFAGYRVTEFLAVEGGVMDLGEASKSGSNATVTMLHGDVLGFMELSTDISAYVKAGLAAWEYEITAPSVASHTDDGVNLAFGIGIDYQVSGQVAARFGLDYLAIKPEDASGNRGSEHLTTISAGIKIGF